uniref:G-patch domain-containing protein n=1 Tax=Angiostrongylus cantonensis TaxID=6313 RepID=A0A0K0DI38_ANGCA
MNQTAELMAASTSGLKSDQKMTISFGVKRAVPTKLQECTPAIGVSVDSDEEREHEKEVELSKKRKLTHFEDGVIPDDKNSKKGLPVVIPMVQEQDWRVTKLLALQKEGKLTDEDQARLAILTESQPYQTCVSIEDFGLAVLRGCGWKDGEGIGRKPQVVPLRILPRRPNGLGLGATPQNPEVLGVKGGKESDDVDKVIKKDSLIRITNGRHKGLYGKVESRDDDNNSLFVRLAVGGQHVKASLFAVQLVSKKEYDRDGKCINKEDYEKEREKIEKKNGRGSEKDARNKDERISYEGYKDKYREKDQQCTKEEAELWVRADLLVRFVDEDYKKGRYFREKMRVVDVASRKNICLEDSQGKMHYGEYLKGYLYRKKYI